MSDARLVDGALVREVAGAAARGALLGFVGYASPFWILRRRFPLRPAAAFAFFVASYRSSRLLASAVRPEPTEADRRRARALCGAASSLAACAVDPTFASPLFSFWFAIKGVREHLPPAHSSWGPMTALVLASWYTIPPGYRLNRVSCRVVSPFVAHFLFCFPQTSRRSAPGVRSVFGELGACCWCGSCALESSASRFGP